MSVPIIIAGATGRFGSLLTDVAAADPDVRVVGWVSSESPLVQCAVRGAVVVDFTVPEATAGHAALAAARGMPMVIATTGLAAAHQAAVAAASRAVPIVQTPNTSLAITLLTQWLRGVAPLLAAQYRVTLEETHHVRKKDAPSGTALRLRDTMAAAGRVDAAAIPIQSHREGDVVGTHAVTFRGAYDTMTITHTATDRRLFCEGALTAAKWVARQPPGLYTMEDVLKNSA